MARASAEVKVTILFSLDADALAQLSECCPLMGQAPNLQSKNLDLGFALSLLDGAASIDSCGSLSAEQCSKLVNVFANANASGDSAGLVPAGNYQFLFSAVTDAN